MHKLDSILVNTQSLEAGEIPDAAFSVPSVREIDRVLIDERGVPGLTLMKRAAEASVQRLQEIWPAAQSIRVYCGSGNNAADGYIVAALLAQQKFEVEVLQVGDPKKLGSDGQEALTFCKASQARMVQISESDPDVIVDALLGTGFKGELRSGYAEAISEINASAASVLAIDVPSGLALEGDLSNEVVVADATVTFIALKQGFLTGPAKNYIGQLFFAPLAESNEISSSFESISLLNLPQLVSKLPKREMDAHKFRFGHVLVIGGGQGMAGAPLMTAYAAMRTGAGLVSLATHPDHAAQLAGLHPEIMIRGVLPDDLEPLLESASVIALGPGLGKSEWGQQLFSAAVASGLPMVVDADGLNILAGESMHRDNWILTPHPGEAGRLLGERISNRFKAADELQNRYGGITVLKGAGTLVSSEAGTNLCLYGNPGMSTAGMGDVLCGVIAGVLGQCNDLSLAANLGVVLHSAAADCLTEQFGERGLMATDLIPEIRRLINGI